MCNLYRMTKPNSEVARWFDAIDQLGGANFGEEVFPGYPGAVVANGALVSMTWGFPLSRKGAKGQPLKPKPAFPHPLTPHPHPTMRAPIRCRNRLA